MDGRPFTRATARVNGITGRQVDQMLARGAIRQELRGIYIDAATTDDVASRARCAAMVLPSGAAVCRQTAAWLWGIDSRSPDHCDRQLPLECAVPTGREPLSRAGVRCFVAPLEARDLDVVAGVPCTTPLRTAVDLLRWLPPHMALGSADALAHAGLIDVAELFDSVERWSGRSGVIQARRLAALVEPLTESFGESWLRLRSVDAGFPRPEPQVKIYDTRGRVLYRVDLGWPDVRKGLEYDGEEYHSSPEARASDGIRLARLRREFRWEVIPVGRGEVLGRSLRLERGIGELLSLEPQIYSRAW